MNGGIPDPGTKHGAWGKTHRYYTFTPTTSPRIAFALPKNCVAFGIVTCATPLAVEIKNIGSTTVGPPAIADEKAASIAGEGFMPTRPVQGGEVVIIEDGVDGNTAIGAITIILEGINLPAAVSDLGIVAAAITP